MSVNLAEKKSIVDSEDEALDPVKLLKEAGEDPEEKLIEFKNLIIDKDKLDTFNVVSENERMLVVAAYYLPYPKRKEITDKVQKMGEQELDRNSYLLYKNMKAAEDLTGVKNIENVDDPTGVKNIENATKDIEKGKVKSELV